MTGQSTVERRVPARKRAFCDLRDEPIHPHKSLPPPWDEESCITLAGKVVKRKMVLYPPEHPRKRLAIVVSDNNTGERTTLYCWLKLQRAIKRLGVEPGDLIVVEREGNDVREWIKFSVLWPEADLHASSPGDDDLAELEPGPSEPTPRRAWEAGADVIQLDFARRLR